VSVQSDSHLQVLPFKISKENALERFKQFHASRWLSPRSLRNANADTLTVEEKFLPFFAYDIKANSVFTAEIQTQTDMFGMPRWSFVSGTGGAEAYSADLPWMQVCVCVCVCFDVVRFMRGLRFPGHTPIPFGLN